MKTTKQREPRKRTVEMEINVGGKKKRLVATNCTIKAPLLSKLGFGKKREVMACESVDIIEPEEEKRAFEEGESLSIEREGNEGDEPEFSMQEERAKAMPRQPLPPQQRQPLPPQPRRDNREMPEA